MNAETHIVPALGHLALQRLTPRISPPSTAPCSTTAAGAAAAWPPRRSATSMGSCTLPSGTPCWGHVARNVAALGRPAQGHGTRDARLEPGAAPHFLDHARQDRLYAAWLLFATTGMRRGEVAGSAGPTWTWRPAASHRGGLRVVVNYEVHIS